MIDATLPVVPFERDKHFDALVRFLEKVYDAKKLASRIRVLNWIHDAMPERDRFPLRHIVLDGGRVAASLGYLPADFLVGGKQVPARFTHDLLVDTDYRGRGLAKCVVSEQYKLGGFLPGGMWMTDPCYRIHLACGFDDMRPLTTHTLILDPSARLSSKSGFFLKRGVEGAALAMLRRRALRRSAGTLKGAGPGALERIDAFDPGLDRIWLRMLGTYGAARLRNAAHLNWKYARHPNVRYRILLARRHGDVAGYMVWRPPVDADGEMRSVIADFLAERGDSATLELLLAGVISEAAAGGAEALSVLTTQRWVVKLIRRLGFLPRPSRHTWVISGWDGVLPASWRRDHDPWHIVLGDSDGDLWTGSQ